MNGNEKHISDRPSPVIGREQDALHRLDFAVETVREMSLQTDPQEMVMLFRKRALRLYQGDGSISLSRRGLAYPQYRVTRNTQWRDRINPWEAGGMLPVHVGGLLGDLLYADRPVVLNGVCISQDDPAHRHLSEARSLVALPLFDNGVSLNMVVRWASDSSRFDQLNLEDALLQANMFGRATHHLLTSKKLAGALAELDYETRRIASIQRSLLPAEMPVIPGVDIAVSYTTATRAGGDYYDFLELPNGKVGLFIADVSGHGAAAAVVMAMVRTMLHSLSRNGMSASGVLRELNRRLGEPASLYGNTFVTAFFAVFDPSDRTMQYSCAGHNPPLRISQSSQVSELNGARSLPLAVDAAEDFSEAVTTLDVGDTLILYTDGITEATNASDEFYGLERLVECVRGNACNAQQIINCTNKRLAEFVGDKAQADDQTMLAVRIA